MQYILTSILKMIKYCGKHFFIALESYLTITWKPDGSLIPAFSHKIFMCFKKYRTACCADALKDLEPRLLEDRE